MFIFIGVGVIALAILAIVFRDRIWNSAIQDESRKYGQQFGDSRRSTPNSIALAAIIPIVIGLVLVISGVVRTFS
jgi:hypothetical protein